MNDNNVPDPGTVGDEDRGPQVCHRCGLDCEAHDYDEILKRWTCIHCEDRRNSVPESFSDEAA